MLYLMKGNAGEANARRDFQIQVAALSANFTFGFSIQELGLFMSILAKD